MQVPSHVEYERATSVEHALALLGRPDHRVLAGGHSLIPMMKLRLAQPGVLVDINGLAELAYIKARRRPAAHRGHGPARGPARLEAVAGQHFPIFHDAERVVADPIVRLWGTIGGSLCQADPSEDLSAVFAAVRATAVIRGQDGDREVPVREFHLGPYETVIGPGELLAEIRVPVHPGTGSAYEKVARRVGDWSVAAAGAVLQLDQGTVKASGHRPDRGRRRALRGGRGRGLPPRQGRHRAELRAGREDRRRALPSRRRPARPRGLQAAPGRRAHHPRAPPLRRRGQQHDRTGRGDRERHRVRARRRAAAAAHPLPAGRARPDRQPLGLRHVQLRQLRRLARPKARQGVHGARGDGRRAHRPYRGGPGAGRPPRPGPAGVHRVPRPAVRFLHAGHDDDRALAARP